MGKVCFVTKFRPGREKWGVGVVEKDREWLWQRAIKSPQPGRG